MYSIKRISVVIPSPSTPSTSTPLRFAFEHHVYLYVGVEAELFTARPAPGDSSISIVTFHTSKALCETGSEGITFSDFSYSHIHLLGLGLERDDWGRLLGQFPRLRLMT